MRFGPVTCGVDIGATCQDKTVEAPDERVESVFGLFVNRQDDRIRAERGERTYVIVRHQRGLSEPRAPRRSLVVSGDPDHRAFRDPEPVTAGSRTRR